MESKKSYYAIIPAEVRYDKSLTNGAKLLYGEITALCNEKGFCWATSKYFADLYENDARTIRRWIQSLVAGRYILVEITDDVNRKIFLCEGGQKCPKGRTKMSVGVGQKRPHNNTSNTTDKKIAPAKPDAPFNFEEELKKMEDSETRHINIIALYMDYRRKTLKVNIQNGEQLSLFIKRHARSASQLAKAKYTDEQLVEAFDITKRKCADIDWTLETIVKHLTK